MHGNYGGKKSAAQHEPSEVEGFALAVGCAMFWCKLRDSTNPIFFRVIAEEVKRAEATQQVWSREEMKQLFHNKVLCGIGQDGVKRHIQRFFAGADAEKRDELARDFVGSIIFRYLATAEAGVDHESALALARKANLNEILTNKVLGGSAKWQVEHFIEADVWRACGEQAGIKEVAVKFMTLLACNARGENAEPPF